MIFSAKYPHIKYHNFIMAGSNNNPDRAVAIKYDSKKWPHPQSLLKVKAFQYAKSSNALIGYTFAQ